MKRFLAAVSLPLLASLLFAAIATAEQQTPIARLVKRNHVIFITQDSTGELRYSIASPDGQSLDMNLNEEQLQAKYPEIHENLRPAIATPTENFNQQLFMLETQPLTQ